LAKDYDLNTTPANAIRRSEYACDDEWIHQFLAHTPVGYVATHWEAQPFITPMNFWYDPEYHEIYFHSSNAGRLHANAAEHKQACFSASQHGQLLPSNIAFEFSIQYESVVAFGALRTLESEADKKRALYGLIRKYFPDMSPGEEYRPITDHELQRTSVYAIAIDSWSGKRNWPERAKQSPEWKPLDKKWFKSS
jgi:nitroimidazol reductase NimA-like FMN-containing flavoprotein (pyridoxamine 5'-phosphate oxidase superfamily)